MQEHAEVKRKALIAAGLSGLVFVMLFATLHSPGLTWDEPYYLTTAQLFYFPWLQRLGTDATQSEIILKYWSSEGTAKGIFALSHPPLGPLWIGITRWMASPLLGDLVAGRLATAILFAGLVSLIFLYVADRNDVASGIVSALCLALSPRLFGHAHLAAMDLHVAALWFASVICFAQGFKSPRLQPLAGLLVGAALLTKATALPLPFLLAGWAVLFHRKKALRPCLFLLLAVPVFLSWPLMWVDTWEHLKGYAGFVQKRPQISVFYFGRSLECANVPIHYPLIMFLLTTPLLVMAGFGHCIISKVRTWKEDPEQLLILGNLLAVFAIVSLPGVPRYDGIRLFLPLYPFLAALAGPGLVSLWQVVATRWNLSGKSQHVVTALLAIQLAWLALMHPLYLSDYNPLAGGLPGASRIGLETTYWCDVIDQQVIDFINETAPKGTAIGIFPYPKLVVLAHLDLGSFRKDLELVDYHKRPADWLILMHRRGMFGDREQKLSQLQTALFGRKKFGVTLCQVFELSR
jgi:4-amino-4-deoxy-L-arabinose transferase-like glycosyltransferase